MDTHLPDEISPAASLTAQHQNEVEISVTNARTALHSKIEARKQTERDAQLLANRIKLLQQEEAKTLRNIELTRTRASRLAAIKHDADIREAQLLEAERLREQERLAAKERNNYIREVEKASRESTKEQIYDRKRRSAMESRQALRKSVQEKLSEEEVYKKSSTLRTEAIRNDRLHSRMRQEESRANRLLEYKERYSQRVEQEDRLKTESDILLSKLEQEELALIRRLQKAQELQSKISRDLNSIPVSPALSERTRKSAPTPRDSHLPPRVSTPISRKDIGGAALR